MIWRIYFDSERSLSFPEIQPHLPPELVELYEMYQVEAQYANGERDWKFDVHNILRVSMKWDMWIDEMKDIFVSTSYTDQTLLY